MGMRAVQESLASCVLGRLAFSEICEHFLEQVLCKHLKKSSQKRQGRTWPGREHGLPGAFGKDAGSWGALNMRALLCLRCSWAPRVVVGKPDGGQDREARKEAVMTPVILVLEVGATLGTSQGRGEEGCEPAELYSWFSGRGHTSVMLMPVCGG